MSNRKSVMIVVHGMGDQRRHSSLIGNTKSLIELMKARGRPERTGDLNVSGDLVFKNQSDAQVEYGDRTWQFAEYWWAQSFIPANPMKVAKWIVFRLKHHLYSLGRSFKRSWRDVFQGEGLKDPKMARAYNFIALPFYIGLMSLLAILTPILMILMVLLGYVKLVPGVPSFIKYFQGLLAKIGIDLLGDIYIYLEDQLQAALIRDGLIRMIEEAVLDEKVDRIVFLAHSTGNLLVYDALAHIKAHHSNSDVILKLEKVRALVSIGSIMTMAWNRSIEKQIEPRFLQPLPKDLHWYHLWTHFDVGPAGPLKIPALVKNGPVVCNRRVNNSDDLLLDHTGYWDNLEQVHALLLEELGGLEVENDFWRGPGKRKGGAWNSRSPETWKDFDMRRKAVAEQAFVRLGTLLTLPTGFSLFMWFNGWAKGVIDFLKLDRLAGRFDFDWLASAVDSAHLSVLGTVALAGLASVVIFAGLFFIYFVVFKMWWWGRHFKKRRNERHEAFKLQRTKGWPQP